MRLRSLGVQGKFFTCSLLGVSIFVGSGGDAANFGASILDGSGGDTATFGVSILAGSGGDTAVFWCLERVSGLEGLAGRLDWKTRTSTGCFLIENVLLVAFLIFFLLKLNKCHQASTL